MFLKLLIANRGEIACRVIRTARRLGIRTVAVYSDADARAMHVALADEACRIGGADAADSYLHIARILEAARQTGADAVHPGYGFLSENAEFAEACAACGVVFVGPPASAIRAMGSKSVAKAIMLAAGVPVVPGYHGTEQSMSILGHAADEVGYPVLIKAVAGGGGRGMRIVQSSADLAEAVVAARRESQSAFGADAVLLEKYLSRPRHVEVQVFADGHGNVIHLFERDCSVQRRHQKIIEEAPAPGVDKKLRARLGGAAVDAARAIDYRGAGTVEFLLAEDESFYFMEMNTRLQVEHPVTEMIVGLDLVEWQLRVAAGERLPLEQTEISANGHAFEARVYAEDPSREFLPTAGVLRHLRFPAEGAHVRVDTGVRQGDAVGIHYDPLIAKLVVWDGTRDAALSRLRTALAEVQVVGLASNVALLGAVASHPAFASGDVDTGFIERHRNDLFPEKGSVPPRFLALACLDVLLRRDGEAGAAAQQSLDPYSPWHSTSGWRLNDDNVHTLAFRDGDRRSEVVVHYRRGGLILQLPNDSERLTVSGEFAANGDLVANLGGIRMKATVVRHGNEMTIMLAGASHRLAFEDPAAREDVQDLKVGLLTAPMPAKVVAVAVRAGDVVTRGATLLVLEAMKMEHVITAPADGIVAAVHYEVGEQVAEGAELVTFEISAAETSAADAAA